MKPLILKERSEFAQHSNFHNSAFTKSLKAIQLEFFFMVCSGFAKYLPRERESTFEKLQAAV